MAGVGPNLGKNRKVGRVESRSPESRMAELRGIGLREKSALRLFGFRNK
jgi:hypothetical protein